MRNSGSSCSESVGPPLWLLAELTYRCPLQCPYCSNPLEFAREGAELSTAEWIEVFRQARELGAAQLGFSGGEPLLRQDLAELIEAGRGLGFYTNLITSGIGLDEARLARFAEAGLDHVQISFQAADEEVNNLLAGSRKAFAQKLAMARAVKAHGYPMVLNFVTHRHNIDNIERIIQLCIELEADYVELATCQFYGWAALNRAGLLPTRAQLERAERITAEYRQRLAAEGNPCKLIFVTPTTTRNGRRPAWAAGPAYSSTSPRRHRAAVSQRAAIAGAVSQRARAQPAPHLVRIVRLQPLPRRRLDARTLPFLRGEGEGPRRLPLPGVPPHRRCRRHRPGLRQVGTARPDPRGPSPGRGGAAWPGRADLAQPARVRPDLQGLRQWSTTAAGRATGAPSARWPPGAISAS